MFHPKPRYEPLGYSTFEGFIISSKDYGSFEDFLKFYSRHEWIFAVRDKADIIKLLKKYFPDTVKQILKRAELVSENSFNIHGSGQTRLGSHIDWHLDFKSGRIWKKDFYMNVPQMFWGDNSDAKIPWELSRFHYLFDIACAYNFNGRQNYHNKIITLIEDWLYENPCPFGINWVNPMEIGIRALNWLGAIQMLPDDKQSDEFKKKFFLSLYEHGDFIFENIDRNGPGINGYGYIFSLVSLMVLGKLFQSIGNADKWYSFALENINKEPITQFDSDGISHESSLNYQITITELFLFAVCFMDRFHFTFPNEYTSLLRQSCEALRKIARPDYTIPNFGDSGSDTLFHIVDRDERNIRHLLDLASTTIGLQKYRREYEDPVPEVLMWTGKKGFDGFITTSSRSEEKQLSLYLKKSGTVAMRDNHSYLGFFVNTVNGGGFGNHKHNDLLSFDYSVDDVNFVVDSGTYIYTGDPSGRNYFRKTSSHSTLEVDGQEINRFLPKILFSVRRDAEIKDVNWESDEERDYVSAEHSGYNRLDNPVIVKRSIYHQKQNSVYVFKDDFMGSGEHLFSGNIILDNMVRTRIFDNHLILLAKDGRLAVIILPDSQWMLERIPHYISRSYGTKLESWKLRYSQIGNAPQSCVWGMFSIDELGGLEEKIIEFYRISSSMGWKNSLNNKLVLKRGAEEILATDNITELFSPRLDRLEKEDAWV